ncbi:hypothetical protein LAZ67_8000135 [Cordylochernes scorpioides]|uniref:Uncharacterized protein n=1 Tax=Cordylochernes scorpioides TaxID=51811 RepID=A0ABY6KSQ7_9ARAC|nr:hypothetical protein LAZ67_8000135 [Cordylochernes scorpioides]
MRQEFASWVFRKIDIDENWLSNVIWTDDAHFSLNGESNIQNSRFWGTENPRIFTEMPLYQPRVTVLWKNALSEITFMKVGGPPHISRGAKQLLKNTSCWKTSYGHHVHPRLHHGLQHIDVGVNVHPETLLKEVGVMALPSLLMTLRTITGAGNFLYITTGGQQPVFLHSPSQQLAFLKNIGPHEPKFLWIALRIIMESMQIYLAMALTLFFRVSIKSSP